MFSYENDRISVTTHSYRLTRNANALVMQSEGGQHRWLDTNDEYKLVPLRTRTQLFLNNSTIVSFKKNTTFMKGKLLLETDQVAYN